MRTWFERVRSTILSAPSPVFIVSGEEWGIPRLVAGLRDPDQPLIWIDLREADCTDAVAIGNAISEAIRRGLGSSLFGLGIDVDYALAALESFVPALEPLTVAVTASEKRPDLVTALDKILVPPNRLVIQSATHCAEFDDVPGANFVDQEVLRITIDEAVDLFAADRPNDEIALAVEATRGAIVSVEQKLMLGHSGSDRSGGVGERIGAALRQGASGVVDALIARRRWVEAFEFAVDHAPTRIAEVLDEAGNSYFEQGQFDRFWRYLSGAPRWALRDEQSMYWFFNAAMAVNKWRTILPQVDRYLDNHEAPDLRALRATAEVNDRSIVEAERAH